MQDRCLCHTNDERYLKQELVRCVKTLFSKGYVSSGGGNHSFRYNEMVWITPSGYPRSHIRDDDLVLIDMYGRIVEGDLKPSIEVPFHTEIYKRRKDVNAVSHAHSPYSHALFQTLDLLKIGEGIYRVEGITFPQILSEIPVLEYRQLGSRALARLVGDASKDARIMVLLDHGVISMGRCIHEALLYIELLEEYARCRVVSRALGDDII